MKLLDSPNDSWYIKGCWRIPVGSKDKTQMWIPLFQLSEKTDILSCARKKRTNSCSHSIYLEEKESTGNTQAFFFNEKQFRSNCAVICWGSGLPWRGRVLLGCWFCFWLAEQAHTAKCLSAYKVSEESD